MAKDGSWGNTLSKTKFSNMMHIRKLLFWEKKKKDMYISGDKKCAWYEKTTWKHG